MQDKVHDDEKSLAECWYHCLLRQAYMNGQELGWLWTADRVNGRLGRIYVATTVPSPTFHFSFLLTHRK